MPLVSSFVIVAPLLLVSAILAVSLILIHQQRTRAEQMQIAAMRLHLVTLKHRVEQDLQQVVSDELVIEGAAAKGGTPSLVKLQFDRSTLARENLALQQDRDLAGIDQILSKADFRIRRQLRDFRKRLNKITDDVHQTLRRSNRK